MDFFSPDETPGSALVVVAHPDDIDFGIAGTVAVLTANGCSVSYALCTSGEAGIPEDMDRDQLRALRESEQRAAAAQVGVHDVRFLGMRDGHLEPNLAMRKGISRVIRELRPDLVITQNPQRRYDSIYASHPDHLACGAATCAAVYPDARNPFAHPSLLDEGHAPHAVADLWIMGTDEPNLAVNIDATLDAKVAALSLHQSQITDRDVAALLTEWATSLANQHGLADRAEHVEVFRRIDAR